MRLKEVLKNLPKEMLIPVGPSMLKVQLALKGFELVPTEKGEYTLEISFRQRKQTLKFYVPELQEDGTYLHHGNSYVGVPSLEPPVVTFQNRPKSRVATLVDPAGADIIFTLFDGRVSIKRGNKSLGSNFEDTYLQTFFLTPEERKTFNQITGSGEVGSFLTTGDLALVYTILSMHEGMETDPKFLPNMRAMTLEDVILRQLMFSLQFAVRPFVRGGDIDKLLVSRDVDRLLSTSPQCQLYRGNNPMALLGLKEKIKVPMRPWASLDEAKPHSTWQGAICPVDTPQSNRAGEILALSHGTTIKDGKVLPSGELLSGLLKKVTLFPHLLDPHRVVMMSSIAEQSVDLGEFNEEFKIKSEDNAELPQPFGCYANIALMDYGFTHEDGCVVSESFAAKLKTTELHVDRFVVPHDRSEERPTVLVEEGSMVAPYSIVMSDLEGEPVRSKVRATGHVVKIEEIEDVIGGVVVPVVEVTTKVNFYGEIGTKLSGLHANKMTISKIYPDWLMPKMENGQAVDIIYSPASVAKRKMPSLIMEMMILKGLNAFGSSTYWSDGKETFEKAAEALEELGLAPDGMEQLRLRGKDLPHRTLVGPAFIMMLYHHPRTKLRLGGKVTYDFRGHQQRGVGQGRYNREELEALFQHGAHGLISEIYNSVGKSELFSTVKEHLKVLGVEEKQ